MQNLMIKNTNNKASIENIVQYIKEEFRKYNILIKKEGKENFYNKEFEINGQFEDPVWMLKDQLSIGYFYYKFFELQNTKAKNKQEMLILIKCWVGESILNNFYKFKSEDAEINRNVQTGFGTFLDFMKASNLLSIDYLERFNGAAIANYINSLSEHAQKHLAETTINFITYIIDKATYVEDLSFYLDYFYNLNDNLHYRYGTRELPSGKDIFYFSSYIDAFFNSENSLLLKKYYMPLLLWWKITMIIPMRPSEFCLGLKRNALKKENDEYYLEINRIKITSAVSYRRLPVLKRIKITQEIYDIINQYIKYTNEYGYTETLISYPALLHFRKELQKKDKKTYKVVNSSIKINDEEFSNAILKHLLISFYENIIKDKYKDNLIEKMILPGDTRHIAFTSLMLQGYSPVEIAILGGHTKLSTLNNYTCSPQTYIDMEVLSLKIKGFVPEKNKEKILVNIILNKPAECPKNINECIKTVIGNTEIGYCTADFKQNAFPCESEQCYNCSKWWCKPDSENYIIIKKSIEKEIEIENKKLQENIEFILSLFNEVGLKVIDGNIYCDETYIEKIKTISKTIKETANNLISLESRS